MPTIFNIKEHWGKINPPPYLNNSAEVKSVKSESRMGNSARSNHSQQKENIEGLVANTPKNDICCIECPPINVKKKPEENCNFMADAKKC